jgi:hypothetical protein
MAYVMKEYKIPENSVDLWISTDPHLPPIYLKKEEPTPAICSLPNCW